MTNPEVMVFGTKQQPTKVTTNKITVVNIEIKISQTVRNIGAFIDSNLIVDSQVNHVRRIGASGNRRNIGKIRKYLTTTRQLLFTLLSELDWATIIAYCMELKSTKLTAKVQNAAVKLLTRKRKFYHVTPILKQLHWLPVAFCIQFKIALFSWKILTIQAPQ